MKDTYLPKEIRKLIFDYTKELEKEYLELLEEMSKNPIKKFDKNMINKKKNLIKLLKLKHKD